MIGFMIRKVKLQELHIVINRVDESALLSERVGESNDAIADSLNSIRDFSTECCVPETSGQILIVRGLFQPCACCVLEPVFASLRYSSEHFQSDASAPLSAALHSVNESLEFPP